MRAFTLMQGEMVSYVIARTLVRCPASEAGPQLSAFFGERSGDDAVARVRLRENGVIVTMVKLQNSGVAFPSYRVAWSSEDGRLYPPFAGRLEIEADEDYNSFFLRVTGDCRPPHTAGGATFDAAVTHTIARATIGEFLAMVAGYAERRYRRAERLKIAARVSSPDA